MAVPPRTTRVSKCGGNLKKSSPTIRRLFVTAFTAVIASFYVDSNYGEHFAGKRDRSIYGNLREVTAFQLNSIKGLLACAKDCLTLCKRKQPKHSESDSVKEEEQRLRATVS
jgi:hypothetical protein